ncbi:unnamed protein product [Periconia digitata]|uniref:Uncharacterized protein n=1 Tax=Periconia digitata TaxID=1303443 RepID=A0A9W4XCY7_9PLEO|nr:unnamed protein product [Periconia digitata]
MSDQPAAVPAAEAASNPTETSNGSNGNAQDVKTAEASAEATATADATADTKSGEQPTEKRNDDNDSNDKRSNDKRESGGRPHRGKRGGFRGDHYNGRKPLRKPIDKSEYENLPESSDPDEIRGQVEFYFSDHNLKQDEHLFLECQGPKNLPVPIKHMCQFKRMRRFTPYTAVVDALRASESLEVVDDGSFSGPGNEGVRRKSALVVPDTPGPHEQDPPTMNDLQKRCIRAYHAEDSADIYVKGFLKADAPNGSDVGQLTLEQFFKPYGSVVVRKRRDLDNLFKGSVFVTFDSAESAQQFLHLDPKPTFNGLDLTIMTKRAYSEMKCREKGIIPDWEKKKNNNSGDTRGRGRGGGNRGRGDRGRGRGRGGRGGRDDRRRRNSGGGDDWNERRDRFQADKGEQGNKRKAEEEVNDGPKKAKLEIKEDE